jgi:hypothetical protein
MLNHPAVAAAIAFLGWLAFTLARLHVWAKGHLSLFIMSGVVYSDPAQMSPPISHVPLRGYDGQFYYRFALNPFNWHPTAYGITVDYNYRYTRLGYPLVTWLLSAGQHQLVPAALIAVNLVCVAVLGWLGAMFARQAGRHALWGLLFAGYFGLVISVGRDTSEPLADACMLGALLAYRRSRYLLAAVLLAYGVLTNEPILVMAVGIALTRLWVLYKRRGRPGTEDLVWVLPGSLYVVLQVLEKLFVHGNAGGAADLRQNITLPFWALVRGLFTDFRLMSWTHLGIYDINLIEFIVLAAVLVSGLLVLRSTVAPVHERVGFVCLVLIEVVMASWQFWGSVFGDGRTYIDAFLMGLVMLVSTPPAGTGRVVTNRRLAWLAIAVALALIVVARRRILFE